MPVSCRNIVDLDVALSSLNEIFELFLQGLAVDRLAESITIFSNLSELSVFQSCVCVSFEGFMPLRIFKSFDLCFKGIGLCLKVSKLIVVHTNTVGKLSG